MKAERPKLKKAKIKKINKILYYILYNYVRKIKYKYLGG